MLLKFVGPGIHIREISRKDFQRVGVDHDAIHVDVRENPFIEVSDEAAEWLMENEKADWKEATEKEAKQFRIKTGQATAEDAASSDEPAAAESATAAAPRGGRTKT